MLTTDFSDIIISFLLLMKRLVLLVGKLKFNPWRDKPARGPSFISHRKDQPRSQGLFTGLLGKGSRNEVGKRYHLRSHSRPQRPRSFWSAPRIATSGLVQRHSVFEWLCKHNRLRPQPIRFVRLDSEHAQSDGKSRTSGVGLGQRSRFLVLTKKSAASGDVNVKVIPRYCITHPYCA